MRTSTLVALVGCLALVGCGGRSADASWSAVDSAGVRIVTSQAPAEQWALEDEPSLSLGAGAEEGPTQFFDVRAMVFLPGDRFAVANTGTEQVRIFSTRGELIAQVGGKGNGPKEFSQLNWLAVRGDSLLTYDEQNDRLTVRDLTGELARTFRLEWFGGGLEPAALLRDGTILSTAGHRLGELHGSGVILDSALISRYDLTGRLIDSIGRLPHNTRVVYNHDNGQTVLPLPFSDLAKFVDAPQGFCTAFGSMPEVRCYGADGAAKMVMRTPAAPRLVQQADRDAHIESELHFPNPYRVQIIKRMRDELIFPDTLPGFADLLSDATDRVWAELYPETGATTVSWQIFEGGRWVGTLVIPAAFRILAVADDRILGVWKDELGVESVRMYRFTRR